MTIAVVAPHPDDEVFGCGGTLLRFRDEGRPIHWIIVTGIQGLSVYSDAVREARTRAIENVAARLKVTAVHQLEFQTARLDTVPMGDLVTSIAGVLRSAPPEQIFMPFPGDAHTDHGVVFRAASACTKWFRFPTVRRVLAYETLSETDFGIDPTEAPFRPNTFSDISAHLEEKMALVREYQTELADFPFPRSEEALRAQAAVRGAQAGCKAAEAFMLLNERW